MTLLRHLYCFVLHSSYKNAVAPAEAGAQNIVPGFPLTRENLVEENI